MCLREADCREGHVWRTKEVDCEVCGKISLELKDFAEVKSRIINEWIEVNARLYGDPSEEIQELKEKLHNAEEWQRLTIEAMRREKNSWLEENQKLREKIEIGADDKRSYAEAIKEYHEENWDIKQENQKLKDDVSIADNKVMYLTNENILLREENRKLKEKLLCIREQLYIEHEE